MQSCEIVGGNSGADEKEGSTAGTDILQAVGASNAEKYVVATQDQTLRAELRRVPGTPLLYCNRSVLVMEPVPDMQIAKAPALMLDAYSQRELEVIRQSKQASQPPQKTGPRRKKKAKGPNPL